RARRCRPRSARGQARALAARDASAPHVARQCRLLAGFRRAAAGAARQPGAPRRGGESPVCGGGPRRPLGRGDRGEGGVPWPTLERHANLVRRVEEENHQFAVEFRVDRWRAVTEATVATRDRAGLFARLAGAFALAGASIVEARIFTFNDGLALDSFSLQEVV